MIISKLWTISAEQKKSWREVLELKVMPIQIYKLLDMLSRILETTEESYSDLEGKSKGITQQNREKNDWKKLMDTQLPV